MSCPSPAISTPTTCPLFMTNGQMPYWAEFTAKVGFTNGHLVLASVLLVSTIISAIRIWYRYAELTGSWWFGDNSPNQKIHSLINWSCILLSGLYIGGFITNLFGWTKQTIILATLVEIAIYCIQACFCTLSVRSLIELDLIGNQNYSALIPILVWFVPSVFYIVTMSIITSFDVASTSAWAFAQVIYIVFQAFRALVAILNILALVQSPSWALIRTANERMIFRITFSVAIATFFASVLSSLFVSNIFCPMYNYDTDFVLDIHGWHTFVILASMTCYWSQPHDTPRVQPHVAETDRISKYFVYPARGLSFLVLVLHCLDMTLFRTWEQAIPTMTITLYCLLIPLEILFVASSTNCTWGSMTARDVRNRLFMSFVLVLGVLLPYLLLPSLQYYFIYALWPFTAIVTVFKRIQSVPNNEFSAMIRDMNTSKIRVIPETIEEEEDGSVMDYYEKQDILYTHRAFHHFYELLTLGLVIVYLVAGIYFPIALAIGIVGLVRVTKTDQFKPTFQRLAWFSLLLFLMFDFLIVISHILPIYVTKIQPQIYWVLPEGSWSGIEQQVQSALSSGVNGIYLTENALVSHLAGSYNDSSLAQYLSNNGVPVIIQSTSNDNLKTAEQVFCSTLHVITSTTSRIASSFTHGAVTVANPSYFALSGTNLAVLPFKTAIMDPYALWAEKPRKKHAVILDSAASTGSYRTSAFLGCDVLITTDYQRVVQAIGKVQTVNVFVTASNSNTLLPTESKIGWIVAACSGPVLLLLSYLIMLAKKITWTSVRIQSVSWQEIFEGVKSRNGISEWCRVFFESCSLLSWILYVINGISLIEMNIQSFYYLFAALGFCSSILSIYSICFPSWKWTFYSLVLGLSSCITGMLVIGASVQYQFTSVIVPIMIYVGFKALSSAVFVHKPSRGSLESDSNISYLGCFVLIGLVLFIAGAIVYKSIPLLLILSMTTTPMGGILAIAASYLNYPWINSLCCLTLFIGAGASAALFQSQTIIFVGSIFSCPSAIIILLLKAYQIHNYDNTPLFTEIVYQHIERKMQLAVQPSETTIDVQEPEIFRQPSVFSHFLMSRQWLYSRYCLIGCLLGYLGFLCSLIWPSYFSSSLIAGFLVPMLIAVQIVSVLKDSRQWTAASVFLSSAVFASLGHLILSSNGVLQLIACIILALSLFLSQCLLVSVFGFPMGLNAPFIVIYLLQILVIGSHVGLLSSSDLYLEYDLGLLSSILVMGCLILLQQAPHDNMLVRICVYILELTFFLAGTVLFKFGGYKCSNDSCTTSGVIVFVSLILNLLSVSGLLSWMALYGDIASDDTKEGKQVLVVGKLSSILDVYKVGMQMQVFFWFLFLVSILSRPWRIVEHIILAVVGPIATLSLLILLYNSSPILEKCLVVFGSFGVLSAGGAAFSVMDHFFQYSGSVGVMFGGFLYGLSCIWCLTCLDWLPKIKSVYHYMMLCILVILYGLFTGTYLVISTMTPGYGFMSSGGLFILFQGCFLVFCAFQQLRTPNGITLTKALWGLSVGCLGGHLIHFQISNQFTLVSNFLTALLSLLAMFGYLLIQMYAITDPSDPIVSEDDDLIQSTKEETQKVIALFYGVWLLAMAAGAVAIGYLQTIELNTAAVMRIQAQTAFSASGILCFGLLMHFRWKISGYFVVLFSTVNLSLVWPVMSVLTHGTPVDYAISASAGFSGCASFFVLLCLYRKTFVHPLFIFILTMIVLLGAILVVVGVAMGQNAGACYLSAVSGLFVILIGQYLFWAHGPKIPLGLSNLFVGLLLVLVLSSGYGAFAISNDSVSGRLLVAGSCIFLIASALYLMLFYRYQSLSQPEESVSTDQQSESPGTPSLDAEVPATVTDASPKDESTSQSANQSPQTDIASSQSTTDSPQSETELPHTKTETPQSERATPTAQGTAASPTDKESPTVLEAPKETAENDASVEKQSTEIPRVSIQLASTAASPMSVQLEQVAQSPSDPPTIDQGLYVTEKQDSHQSLGVPKTPERRESLQVPDLTEQTQLQTDPLEKRTLERDFGFKGSFGSITSSRRSSLKTTEKKSVLSGITGFLKSLSRKNSDKEAVRQVKFLENRSRENLVLDNALEAVKMLHSRSQENLQEMP